MLFKLYKLEFVPNQFQDIKSPISNALHLSEESTKSVTVDPQLIDDISLASSSDSEAIYTT